MVAGVACCAVYTVLTRRWLTSADSTIQVVFAQQARALGFALVLVVVVGLFGGSVRPQDVSVAGPISAVGSGVLYYGLASWCYLSALRAVPASLAAASFYLIPVFGVAGGVLLLGERLDPTQWLGVATVLLSVGFLLRRTTSPPSASARLSSSRGWRKT